MTLRHALRSLKRTPGFTSAVILTLVLGIASVGSMFAIVYGVLLAPLPYAASERLVSVGLDAAELGPMGQSPAVYQLYEGHARQISDIGFYRHGVANLWVDGDGAAAERVDAAWMTASTLNVLQVAPLLGRGFNAEEEQRGAAGAVMLSETEWRTRFNASPDVLGKTITVNSVPREIVGVMPARFAFPTADTRVWLAVRYSGEAVVGEFAYSGVARLADGATPEQAQREFAALLPRLAELFPQLDTGATTANWLAETKPAPVVVPLRDQVIGDIAQTLWMLAAAAALVLLVAWANVANLMLIRADARQLELAVRESLGASRLRIASHLLGESLLLGVTAGILALIATHGAVRALVAFGPGGVPRLAELGVGLPVAGFIVLVTIVGIIVCAVLPAIRSRRGVLSINLRDGGRGESVGKARQRLRALIVAFQIAIALVVSLGSALLLRTAHQLSEVHPGFDASNATIVWTLLPFANYDNAATVAFHARLIERVSQLPTVQSAGATSRVPMGSRENEEQMFRSEGDARAHALPVNIVDGAYFATMRVPLLAGRDFNDADAQRSAEIVISQSAAVTLFGSPDITSAVGKRLTLAPSGPSYTVIGVAGDVRDQDLATAPSALVYRPQVVPTDTSVEPTARHAMALVVRSSTSPDVLVPAIREIVRDLDPTVPLFNVETMDDVIRGSTARLSLMLTLMTASALVTLLLGAVGLYGVMSYMVALRTREFGVRVALGANPKRIARLVATRGLALTAAGVAAGFVLYAVATPFLSAFLYGVTATDPLTLIAATLVLIATASVASLLPALRAARVDPSVALRAE